MYCDVHPWALGAPESQMNSWQMLDALCSERLELDIELTALDVETWRRARSARGWSIAGHLLELARADELCRQVVNGFGDATQPLARAAAREWRRPAVRPAIALGRWRGGWIALDRDARAVLRAYPAVDFDDLFVDHRAHFERRLAEMQDCLDLEARIGGASR